MDEKTFNQKKSTEIWIIKVVPCGFQPNLFVFCSTRLFRPYQGGRHCTDWCNYLSVKQNGFILPSVTIKDLFPEDFVFLNKSMTSSASPVSRPQPEALMSQSQRAKNVCSRSSLTDSDAHRRPSFPWVLTAIQNNRVFLSLYGSHPSAFCFLHGNCKCTECEALSCRSGSLVSPRVTSILCFAQLGSSEQHMKALCKCRMRDVKIRKWTGKTHSYSIYRQKVVRTSKRQRESQSFIHE